MSDAIATMLSRFQEGGSPTSGLPAGAYTDDRFWRVECDTVLNDTWVCVGFVHELPDPGDVTPTAVAGKPILLARNANGDITAFHNVCRHRCMTLVDQPKNVGKMIRCPYHAWVYDLDGRLRASPHFGGTGNHKPDGFDKAEYSLRPVRVAVWHDWIFVNLSDTAPPFEEYAAPLIKRLEGIDFDKVNPISTLDFGEIATNWKFLMENFIEPYHVQFVHPKTTSQPLKHHRTIVDGVCLGSAVDLKEEDRTANRLAVSSRYLTLFPNFIIGRYFPDQIGVYLNIPLGAGRTAQKRGIYTTEGQQLNEFEVKRLSNLWWAVHKEDHEICERMQRGRASPVAEDGGVLSPHWEDSVRAFQEMIVAAVTGAGPEQSKSATNRRN